MTHVGLTLLIAGMLWAYLHSGTAYDEHEITKASASVVIGFFVLLLGVAVQVGRSLD